jgi:hypothetical protein
MRKTTSTGICAAIVAITAAVVTAQAPTPQNNGSSSSADTKTVVTGCLKEAPASATEPAGDAARGGTPPAAGSASPAAAKQFVLENATASGSSDSSNKSGSQTYQLIANPTALAPHAGKKLELTGTLEPASGSNGPTLKVESGKIVAPSCS